MTEKKQFEHDWVSPPGDTISDILKERDWKKAELAERLGVTKKHINEVLKGRASITPALAQKLEHIFGAPAKFWLKREANYQAAKRKRKELDELKNKHAHWLKQFPVSWMIERRWIKKHGHKGWQISELLNFFEVADMKAYEKRTDSIAVFRASPSFEKNRDAVAAWLCQGERLARDIHCEPYSRKNLKKSLSYLRELSNESSPRVFLPKLVEKCAENGVAVVLLRHPPKCPVSGAAKWISTQKALLILSARHKSNDHLWFSFFHEIGHILKHGKKPTFVDMKDEPDTEQEQQADAFARDILIPPPATKELLELVNSGNISRSHIVDFSKRIGIAPGIVVGRMQKEGWLSYSYFNDLKIRYQWNSDK